MKEKTTTPTSAEITQRLRIVSELRNLCLSLGRAKKANATARLLQEQNRTSLPDT